MNYQAIATHCANSLAEGGDPIDGWGPMFYLLEHAGIPLDAWRNVGEWQPLPDDSYDPTGELPEAIDREGLHVIYGTLYVVGSDLEPSHGEKYLFHWRFVRA